MEIKRNYDMKNKTNARNIWLWVIAGCCLALVGIIALLIMQHGILTVDTTVYSWIARWQSNSMTQIAKAITMLGSAAVLIAIAALALLRKNRKLGIVISLNLIIITIANCILKLIIQRQRPDEALRLVQEHGFSFPSRTLHGKHGFLWITHMYHLDKCKKSLLEIYNMYDISTYHYTNRTKPNLSRSTLCNRCSRRLFNFYCLPNRVYKLNCILKKE